MCPKEENTLVMSLRGIDNTFLTCREMVPMCPKEENTLVMSLRGFVLIDNTFLTCREMVPIRPRLTLG